MIWNRSFLQNALGIFLVARLSYQFFLLDIFNNKKNKLRALLKIFYEVFS